MLDDLDRTIEMVLKHELPPDLVDQVTVSFATPDDQFPPTSVTLPAVDLFLYDVRENRDLREVEWRVERRSDGAATKKRPPVRVDCSYLITAWPSDSSTTPERDEHRLLGEVMKVLLRHATLPESVLQGSLQASEVPLPTSSLQAGRLQSLAEFWQALGGKPKVVLNYLVTIGVAPDRLLAAGQPVIDTRLKFRSGIGEE